MRTKETLQLRHQLSASGLSLRAAAYDTKRHHVLSFDSHPLRPHALRLFSLRRELKSVPLFSDSATPAASSDSSAADASQGQNRSSLSGLHQLQEKRLQQQQQVSKVEVVVPSMLLQYSATMDVFVCVYSRASRPKGATKVPRTTTHFVLLLEPASLRKLLLYSGPETHSLQCAMFDSITDRVVLASHLTSDLEDGEMLPKAPRNVVEILQLSKRADERQTSWPAGSGSDKQQPRTLLFIENTRASLRHPETLTMVCGSKGLKELYGAANAMDTSSSALLEWRQNQPTGKFVLVRRVMLREKITALAVSPCRDWLLAGFVKGGLRVWNVNGSRTNGSALFTIDTEPFEPTGLAVLEAQAAVISSLEITTTPAPGATGDTTTAATDVIVIAAERDTGAVRHWMLSVERKVFESSSEAAAAAEHRYPKLTLVGYFNAGSKDQVGKEGSPAKFKNQDTLGPPLKTLVMCVTIDMGGCFENLLLVVREDVIHVLKVQTVLYVMQEFASIEEAYAVRAIMQQGDCKVLSLSSTAACKLRIFALDETTNQPSSPSAKLLFIQPSVASAHVSSMETVTDDNTQLSFVVLAWSSGVVDVYDVLRGRHIMTLQDKQLTDQISALAVVIFQRITKSKNTTVDEESDEAPYCTPRSFRGRDHASSLTTNTTGRAQEAARKTLIIVGTETGKLYGWKADAIWDDGLGFHSIGKSDVRVKAAHSSHVIQLARVTSEANGELALLASAGADGILKLWKLPSLKMIGYVSSNAEGLPVTPSCIELMKSKADDDDSGRQTSSQLYVAAGYEDGRLAVWGVDSKRVSFQRLEVSTKHERRVSKICRISSELVPPGSTEFMSCSLDMTVIQWQVSGTGGVQEKRYFDVGTAVVDMILIREQVVVALAHEVCKFAFAPSVKCDMKYLLKPAATVETSTEAIKLQNEEPRADSRIDPEEYPDTPTTRSVEDPTEVAIPSRQTSRSVDEYLTLHVPSAVLHLEAASSSVIAAEAEADSGSAPVTRTSEQEEECPPNSARNEVDPGYLRRSKSTDKLQRPLIDEDTLRSYLDEYIAQHGTGGTMAANRITHLLALRPELPSIRRPGFALAKSLKDMKLSAQDRVGSEEALQVLRLLFAMSRASCQSFDAPTMTRSLKTKEHTSERARAQRLRERKQARRKPVVTYNLLGEKYVQWEDVSEERQMPRLNQSPASPTNSLVVHTPPSPKLRDADVVGFEGDLPHNDIGFLDAQLSSSTADTAGVLSTSSRVQEEDSSNSQSPVDNSEPSNVSPNEVVREPETTTLTADQPDLSEDSEEGDEEDESVDSDGSGENDAAEIQEQHHVVVSSSVEASQASLLPKKAHHRKRLNNCAGPIANISKNALVNSIRLSPMFQPLWTKGYCWCSPSPALHIIWTDKEVKSQSTSKQESRTATVKRKPKCKTCRKRLHTVELPRVGYAPHFSRQATFDIIVSVYSKLTATAHARLYKNSSPRKERPSDCSIFGALFEVFLATYGMREAVEMKLKLFFVSMCHFLPEYDAVAVFGELLGLHTSDDVAENDQAPSTLVALCVCCYSWLYSRAMVVNGDPFSGRLRGGNIYKPVTTEVAPGTDGTTHWQFVRLEHALLCAQDNLLYPLVSPGFLKNVMLFMQEYAQRTSTRSLRTDSPDITHDGMGGSARWIELHRFLRLLVGEWKQQNAEFRVVERLLFVYPQRDATVDSDLLEKLRLMLSCFVFYDHERVGAMSTSDFESLLFKLRYLWSDDSAALASKGVVFENAVVAAKKRFLDLNHDGQLCYLDFWAMLYIVGVKTRGLIHFHEIPSFCRDYRLEVSPELSDMVWNYMQLSCTLLLPKGLQIGKSSIDQKSERQHRRRVGGLHDGTFHITKTMKSSLSTQELLAGDESKGMGLFLDGTIPATRQTASTTALERFRSVSVDNEFGREPVVVGVRSTGPTPKSLAPLRVSLMGNFDLSPDTGSITRVEKNDGRQPIGTTHASGGGSAAAYTNMYIQFPQIPPVRRRIGPNETSFSTRQIAFVADDSGSEDDAAVFDDSKRQQDEELVQMGELPTLSRTLSQRSMASVKEEIQQDQVVADQPDQVARRPSLERRRSTTAVVVVPTVETAASISRGSSKSELFKRQPSGLQRAVSERIRLEEIAAQLGAEKIVVPARQPAPETSSVAAREESPPDTESDESPSVASSDEGSEAGGNGDEEADEQEEDNPFEQVTPDVSAPIIVDEDPPTPEVVQAPVEVKAEPTLPLILEPRAEKVNTSVLSEVETSPEPQEIPKQVVEEVVLPETEAVVEEVASPDEPPIEEPPPPVESIPDLEEAAEDVIEEEARTTIADHQYKPQVIKVEDIQIHHAFRFSQQPTFIRSVAVTNNPYRTTMWNPNDDSGSDDDDGEKIKNGKAEGFDLDESVYSSGDEYAGDSVNKARRTKEGGHTSTSSQEREPSAADMPKTELKRQSSSNLTRLDSNLQPTQRNKKDRQTVPLEYRFSEDLEAIQDEGDDELRATALSIQPVKRKRLDEDAERALYGERVVNVLGEGIAFSPEAEAAMQQKWHQFFDDSESKMFAAMRHDLEKKQTEQREAEERQRKLRKKWQEQRDQDLQRLQNSRHNSIVMSTTNSSSANGGVEASFRLRRIHRESCRQFTQELQFGVSEQREFKEAKETHFFHFYYLPEGHGSIITLKMHVLHGDAEVFMSTDTKVPCSTDFMWRSADRTTKDSGEGQRIILYPHDLLRVVTAATTNAAPTEHAAATVEANASTASLRSFYPKQPDTTSLRIGFYLSVVALEPGTTFTLAVMSSGQKMQPSRAIQTVDYLIDRFNMLSRSFQGQPIVPFTSKTGTKPPQEALRREISRQSSADSINETMGEAEGDNNDGKAEREATETAGGRRKTKNVDLEGVDPEELKSFQHLLETLSEKKGAGSPRAASILLSGPSDEHLEFVQDEDQRLQDIHRQLSPPKSCPEGYRDSMSVVTERRLTLQGKRQKLRRVVAARLQQKLEPLRHKSIAGGALEKSASTGALANIRVAKTAPRPVAYSLTTLDPLPRSQRFKAATAPPLQTRPSGSSVPEKVSADGAESAKRA